MNETNTAKRKKLTKVQLEVLEAVAKGESAHRPAPVYHKVANGLERRGYLVFNFSEHRSNLTARGLLELKA